MSTFTFSDERDQRKWPNGERQQSSSHSSSIFVFVKMILMILMMAGRVGGVV
jgi:hypothetical protein